MRYYPLDPEYSLPPAFSFRHLADLVVCLIVTIVCVRTFLLEGYLISTGSMAPGLLGYHKRVVCPRCTLPFQIGVAFDDDEEEQREDPKKCRCPNCGEAEIDISEVPRTQGDQLLVHKNAFLFRQPDRWEVVVFRNPAEATEAYVKRVVGLPGERVQIINGDVFINGERARKNFAQALATQLVVYDTEFQPDDANWRNRWKTGRQWSRQDNAFVSNATADWSWMRYNHWLRTGGSHETFLRLPPNAVERIHKDLAADDTLPFPVRSSAKVHVDAGELRVRGVVDPRLTRWLLDRADTDEFRVSIEGFAARSHSAPIVDTYGYNASQTIGPVHDLGLELVLHAVESVGEFAMRLETPSETFEVAFDLSSGRVELFGEGRHQALESAQIDIRRLADGLRLSLRHVDEQVCVAADNELIFPPRCTDRTASRKLTSMPVAFACRHAALTIRELRVIRDIHYTEGREINGIHEEFVLGDEEYFVLGDNSPVSSDSRNWSDGAMPASHLIGKPVIVHLPSSPKTLKIGGNRHVIRIPQFSRVRLIR